MAEKCKTFPECMESYVSDSLIDDESTIENLTLPAFISFFEKDEVIEKYKKERETIQQEYQGKDFLTHTLQKLICELRHCKEG